MIIYLYVKQHASTGLKYFGKTTRSNPYTYNGSGKYWQYHLKKHGANLLTLEVYGFDDIEYCTAFALEYSRLNNIVQSDEWANLREENGRDGGVSLSEDHKAKLLAAHVGIKRSPETIAKIRASNLGKKRSAETKAKLSERWKTRVISDETKAKMKAAQLSRRERERRLPAY